MAAGIARPKEHLELGARVRFHHRACVARVRKKEYGDPFEPCWEVIRMEGGGPDPLLEGNWVEKLPTGRRNKTIIVWPAEGEGIVIGLIRRGIGNSHAGYTSGYEYPEYEPGWFTAHEWHWLYEVKTSLRQKDKVYAPLWACALIAG
jgi:hypothetical protein